MVEVSYVAKLDRAHLVETLKLANDAAFVASSAAHDGGTCNLDTLCLHLPNVRKDTMRAIAAEAGVGLTKYIRAGEWAVHVAALGQANANTAGVEAARAVFKRRGYMAYIRYVID